MIHKRLLILLALGIAGCDSSVEDERETADPDDTDFAFAYNTSDRSLLTSLKAESSGQTVCVRKREK